MTTAVERIQAVLKRFDLAVTRYSRLERLRKCLNAASNEDIELLISAPSEQAPSIITYLPRSTAQVRQDLFVLSQLNFKRGGFFVEFGAANGVHHSNTYLLEKEFNWSGILAEPAVCWHDELRNKRKAAIATQCVWKESNRRVTFNETDAADLSTIDLYGAEDVHKDARKSGKRYEVVTISLNDLLLKHNAPSEIDYLSIDTEGSEFDILSNFDFGKHRFRVITCEHNYTPLREKIRALLSSRGYVRKWEHLSKQDDWYVQG